MALKVLLISHTYVAPVNRAKVAALAEQEGLEVGLLVPRSWPDTLGEVRLSRSTLPGVSLFPSPVFMAGKGKRYVYPPWILVRVLAHFRPELVHVEEEPDSLALAEVSLLKRAFGYKIVFFTWENILRRARVPLLEILNLRSAAGAFAGSAGAAAVLLAKGFQKPVCVLPQLGVDPERFKPQDASRLKGQLALDKFVVGYIGRFTEEKGLFVLLRAVAGLETEAQLLLLGRGPLRGRLTEEASSLGLGDRVVVLDAVPHAEVPRYLDCLDVLVLASLTTPNWKEQFGHVLIEAMACEVPVIGSDSGAIPEVIGDAGLIFREGDADDLKDKLAVLAADPSLRRQLAKRGRQRVLERFTHHHIARATAQFYAEVLSR